MIDITIWMKKFLETLDEIFLNLKNGRAVDFDSMSEILFTWSKKWISDNS